MGFFRLDSFQLKKYVQEIYKNINIHYTLMNESRLWIFLDIRVIAFSVVYRYLARLYGEPMSFVFRHRCCYFSNLDGHKRRFLPVDCSFSSEIHVNRLKMHVDLIDKGNKITESTLHFHPGRLAYWLNQFFTNYGVR